MNMKRYLTTLIALVAMVSGAWAEVTDYGFKIAGIPINSRNYQSQSQSNPSTGAWYYDPESNVLHFIKGNVIIHDPLATQAIFLEIDGEINPDLKISVDDNCHITETWGTVFRFVGSGHHVIYGSGSLTMSAQWEGIEIPSGNAASLTIEDVSLVIAAYGGKGLVISNEGSVSLNHCEMKINTTDGQAWIGGGGVTLKYCRLSSGLHFGNNGLFDSSLSFANDAVIERLEPIEYLSYTVDQPTVGQPLHYTAIANGEGYSMVNMVWWKEGGPNEVDQRLEDGYICKTGEVYKVLINSKLSDGYCYTENVTASINGKPVVLSDWGSGMKQITYTFPQLANTYYDLWVGGKQVNDYNQNDVLGDGKVKYMKSVFGSFLYLTDATITNTGNTQYDYTGYGRGIYSNLDGLTVSVKGNNTIESNGEGIYFKGDLTLLGGGTLSIKGSSGIRTNSQGTSLSIYGIELTAEATSGTGIGGPIVSGKNCTMSVSGENTIVKACGPYLSIGNLKDLELSDGLKILQPNGAVFSNNDVIDANGTSICGPWVVIGKESSITTGIENGQRNSVKGQRDEWFTLDGQKLSGKPTKKGIYIHNGKAVVH